MTQRRNAFKLSELLEFQKAKKVGAYSSFEKADVENADAGGKQRTTQIPIRSSCVRCSVLLAFQTASERSGLRF